MLTESEKKNVGDSQFSERIHCTAAPGGCSGAWLLDHPTPERRWGLAWTARSATYVTNRKQQE